jgi:hypothetical protein
MIFTIWQSRSCPPVLRLDSPIRRLACLVSIVAAGIRFYVVSDIKAHKPAETIMHLPARRLVTEIMGKPGITAAF